jgi:putative transcriptional regulator
MAKAFKSLQGKLLLDGGSLAGSFFHRTVVLICQHDPQGAFGLILNRPAPTTLGEALVANMPHFLKEQPLFVGGPVQAEALSYLHSDQFMSESNVMANLHMDHSLENLIEIGDNFSPTRKIKIFAGYAGWSPGQLDDEMRRKAWLTHPASLDLVFNEKPEVLWPQILKEKGWRYKLLAESPEDLSWN